MNADEPDLDATRIEFCSCPEGVYWGAQKMGTPPRCERCGFLPDLPWVHAALAASLPTQALLDELERRGECPCGCGDAP